MFRSAGNAQADLPHFTPDLHELGTWVARADIGKLKCTGTVTLAANTTSTTVADARASSFSFIAFAPQTANAASADAAGTIWASTLGKGTFTVAHPNSAAADKTFRYIILG